jgi:hypothetical protein
MPYLDAVLMLKSTLSNCRLWDMPNTGHAIKLENPAAFNACVESVLSAVERGSWRRSVPGALGMSDREVCRRARRDGLADHVISIRIGASDRCWCASALVSSRRLSGKSRHDALRDFCSLVSPAEVLVAGGASPCRITAWSWPEISRRPGLHVRKGCPEPRTSWTSR